jgi:hypothetical protein
VSGVYLFLLLVFCAYAHAADKLVECEPQRVRDHRYWSFRVIDGRACWYPGRPGKPKAELRWPSPSNEPVSEAARPEVTVTPVDLAAVPAIAPIEEPQLTENALRTFGIQRMLETEPPRAREPDENNFGQMTRSISPPAHRERLPIWVLVLIVVAIVGAAFLTPIIRSLRNG